MPLHGRSLTHWLSLGRVEALGSLSKDRIGQVKSIANSPVPVQVNLYMGISPNWELRPAIFERTCTLNPGCHAATELCRALLRHSFCSVFVLMCDLPNVNEKLVSQLMALTARTT